MGRISCMYGLTMVGSLALLVTASVPLTGLGIVDGKYATEKSLRRKLSEKDYGGARDDSRLKRQLIFGVPFDDGGGNVSSGGFFDITAIIRWIFEMLFIYRPPVGSPGPPGPPGTPGPPGPPGPPGTPPPPPVPTYDYALPVVPINTPPPPPSTPPAPPTFPQPYPTAYLYTNRETPPATLPPLPNVPLSSPTRDVFTPPMSPSCFATESDLRSAIASSPVSKNDDPVVLVLCPGRLVLSDGPFIIDNLRFELRCLEKPCVIDTATERRLFEGAPSYALLRGFTLQNGKEASSQGGAILLKGGELHLVEMNFRANEAMQGGALYVENGSTLEIRSSGFAFNKAAEDGGAINVQSGDVTIGQSSTFTSNEAGNFGGGVIFQEGGLSVDFTVFQSNKADNGGALYMFEEVAVISDSAFRSNTAMSGGGGAISVQYSKLDLQRTSFHSNESPFIFGHDIDIGDDLPSTAGGTSVSCFGSTLFCDGRKGGIRDGGSNTNTDCLENAFDVNLPGICP